MEQRLNEAYRLERIAVAAEVPISASLSDRAANYLESLDCLVIATRNKLCEYENNHRNKEKGVPAVKVLDEKLRGLTRSCCGPRTRRKQISYPAHLKDFQAVVGRTT